MFKLSFDFPALIDPIQLSDKIVSMGSCFSQNIGARLEQHKFQTCINPVGTIFNPISIFEGLTNGLNPEFVFSHNEVHYHWDAHGDLSCLTAEELLTIIAQTNETVQTAITNSDWLLLTFGSAFAYRHKSLNKIVANCHKVPQSAFSKELLTVDKIMDGYHHCIRQLREANPKLKVLLTVSPVRHLKDGLHENNISKGILHQAVHQITTEDPLAHYFPAYEIMIDELRDYRFYAADMTHPSEQAIEYIWQQFVLKCMQPETQQFIAEWQKIRIGLQHRPFHPETGAHQKFLNSLLKKVKTFDGLVDVKSEIRLIESQLI